MNPKIISILDTVADAIPALVIDRINTLYHAIPPLWWWVILGILIALFFTLQIVRLVKKIRQGKEIPAEKVATEAPSPTDDQIPVEETREKTQRPEETPVEKEPVSFFERLKGGLAKTRKTFSGSLETIFADNRKLDDDMLEEIEELLITSDIGVATTMALTERLSQKAETISDFNQLKTTLKNEILSLIDSGTPPPESVSAKPHVIMVVGVNGVGKTTTIGKLAAQYQNKGKKVLIAASDTFRAAAVEQLTIWAERAGADIVKHKENADPSAVAYDGVEAAMARGVDIVLVDTAGRLHTRKDLMEEMKKIKRTIGRKIPEAPHETLLVLDATTGQNALTQAKLFMDAIGITGLALTKLDGTAKGGIVVSICSTLKLPLKYIGVGEQVEDMQDFDPKQFVDALF